MLTPHSSDVKLTVHYIYTHTTVIQLIYMYCIYIQSQLIHKRQADCWLQTNRNHWITRNCTSILLLIGRKQNWEGQRLKYIQSEWGFDDLRQFLLVKMSIFMKWFITNSSLFLSLSHTHQTQLFTHHWLKYQISAVEGKFPHLTIHFLFHKAAFKPPLNSVKPHLKPLQNQLSLGSLRQGSWTETIHCNIGFDCRSSN